MQKDLDISEFCLNQNMDPYSLIDHFGIEDLKFKPFLHDWSVLTLNHSLSVAVRIVACENTYPLQGAQSPVCGLNDFFFGKMDFFREKARNEMACFLP